MAVRALTSQFLRDLRASWPKTALLGMLLLVGFYFWLPLFFGLVGRSSSDSTGTPPGVAPPAAGANLVGPQANSTTHAVAAWEQLEAATETDPLVRSAAMAAIQSDPFRLDTAQFPPPVLFAEEPRAAVEPAATSSPAGPLQTLQLKSTIVGVSRRAAFINGKLYFEGSDVPAGGTTFVLAEVHPRRVVLRRGRTEYELKISTADTAPAQP